MIHKIFLSRSMSEIIYRLGNKMNNKIVEVSAYIRAETPNKCGSRFNIYNSKEGPAESASLLIKVDFHG